MIEITINTNQVFFNYYYIYNILLLNKTMNPPPPSISLGVRQFVLGRVSDPWTLKGWRPPTQRKKETAALDY